MSRLVLSVSELATAVACPRLLYLHRKAGGPTWLFESGRSFALGRLFHCWVAQAIREARGRGSFPQALKACPTATEAQEILADFLYRQAFFPWLEVEGARYAAAELVQVWDSLSEVARFFGELVVAAGQARLPLTRLFLPPEQELAHRLRVDALNAELRGRIDALIRDPRDGRLTLLEFKTRPDRNPEADLIQIAAYTWLLEREEGIRADGALAYFTPQLEIGRFPRADLELAVGQQLPAMISRVGEWLHLDPSAAADLPPAADPRLCTICPHHPPCPLRFPIRARQGKPPGPPPREMTPTPREPLQDRLVQVLGNFRCPVEPLGRQAGPTFIRYRLRPAAGVTVASIRNRQEDLKVQLGLEAVPLVQAGPGYVSVDVQRQDREFVPIGPVLERLLPGLCPIPLGMAVDGRLVSADLADPNTCHVLIGGTPGSGKSEFLKAVLLSLAHRHRPSQLRLVLIDAKQVTFTPFAGLPHLQAPVVTGLEEAVAAVAALSEEMDRRYARFTHVGTQDLAGYVARGFDDLPRIVVLFDEFGDCMLQAPKLGRTLEAAVVRLAQKARAAGVHLILATQKPVVKVITGLIKGNLPARIAFRVASRIDSQVILDCDDAAFLLGKGDMVAQWAGTSIRLQSPYVPGGELPPSLGHVLGGMHR